MIDFTMPALGSDMDEGTLDQWLVAPGDTVTRGQVVAVVETTKAAVEVECWHDGVVGELLVPVGETVQVGTPLATLLAPGETAQPTPRTSTAPSAAAARAGAAPAAVAPATVPPAATEPHRRRWVSPAARRVAKSLGVDITTVTGTGPQGAVTITDVEHAAAAKQPRAKPTVADRAAQIRKSIAMLLRHQFHPGPRHLLADPAAVEGAMPASEVDWPKNGEARLPLGEPRLT